MKQSETKCFQVGDGAANLMECSNLASMKIPNLTIMQPRRLGRDDIPTEEPQSINLYKEQVRQLYEALKEYFEEP